MSKIRSIRLLDELEPWVAGLPRGAFSLITNRLLQLYFTDDKLRARVDGGRAVKLDPPPTMYQNPSQPIHKTEAHIVADTPVPDEPAQPEEVVQPESYSLLDSIIPK